MNKRLLTKAALAIVLLFSMILLAGCKKKEESPRKELDFTVCARDNLPDELFAIIEEKKDRLCKFTYANGSYMYIVVCYGEREKDNLNVVVNDLFITSNAIYVDTVLKTDISGAVTPTDYVASGEYSMYPYIVLKCEKYDVPVVFKVN